MRSNIAEKIGRPTPPGKMVIPAGSSLYFFEDVYWGGDSSTIRYFATGFNSQVRNERAAIRLKRIPIQEGEIFGMIQGGAWRYATEFLSGPAPNAEIVFSNPFGDNHATKVTGTCGDYSTLIWDNIPFEIPAQSDANGKIVMNYARTYKSNFPTVVRSCGYPETRLVHVYVCVPDYLVDGIRGGRKIVF